MYDGCMKTTIDLPEEILHRAKIVAAQRRTTLKELVLSGLDHVLGISTEHEGRDLAIARMRKGMKLGAKPLDREEIHARR